MAEDNIPVGGVREEPFFKFNENIDIPLQIDDQGNVIFYRATNSPDYLQVSDFVQKNKSDIGSLGFGQHSYFGPNIETPQAFWVASTNRGLYKYDTNIKPSEIFIGKIGDKPELAKALGIPEQYWNMNYHRFLIETKDTYRKVLTDNIELFKQYGIKALGRYGGTSGPKAFEIIPLITNEDNLGIKAVAELEPIEGLGKGGADNWKVKETSLDTPTNVVDYQDTGIGGRPLEIENGIPVDANSNPINSLGAADETITIYRVVPEGIDNVNANDWVFINEGQAEEALKNANTNSSENFKIIELEVSKGNVYPSAKSGNLEMGYFPTDTPTNVVGAEVIDEGVDITESSAGVVDEIERIQGETLEKLRNANAAFVDQQLDDIMARKINEVLPFVDTSISRAEAIGIAITGPQVLDSADPVLNSFIKKMPYRAFFL